MTQNTSPAVMAQRREAHDSLDGHRGSQMHWLPPCRKFLEVPEDYQHA